MQSGFDEDEFDYRSPWVGGPDFAPGAWLGFCHTIDRASEFFLFMARLCQSLPPEQAVSYAFSVRDLAGRTLVSERPGIPLRHHAAAKLPSYSRRKTFPAGALQGGWQDEFAEALRNLFVLFEGASGRRIEIETLKGWIAKFVDRA